MNIYQLAQRQNLSWEWSKDWLEVYVDGHHYSSFPRNNRPKVSLEKAILSDVISEIRSDYVR